MAASLVAADTSVVVHRAVVAGSMVVEAAVEGTASLVVVVVGPVETLDIFPLSYAGEIKRTL